MIPFRASHLTKSLLSPSDRARALVQMAQQLHLQYNEF